jgi:hypothetical protein
LWYIIILHYIISYLHHLQPLHRYVGIFGNADPLDIAQWFSVATSVPTPTRRFDPRTGVCSNMFTGEPVHPRTSLYRIQQRIYLLYFDFTSLPCTPLNFILFYLVPVILTTPYAPLVIDRYFALLTGLNFKFLVSKSGEMVNPQNKIVAAIAEVTVTDLITR